jgi:hypothetical protein
MAQSVQELEAEIMKLDLTARAALAEKLLQSLEDLSDSENERLWLDEALRRREEMLSGNMTALDGEAVMNRQFD